MSNVSRSVSRSNLVGNFFVGSRTRVLAGLVFIDPIFSELLGVVRRPLYFRIHAAVT